MVNTEEEMKAARKYAGLDKEVNPKDFQDRHFNMRQCEKYDAFLAGLQYQKLLKLN